MRNLPHHTFEHNQTWLETLAHRPRPAQLDEADLPDGELATAEPKRLRQRLLHTAGQARPPRPPHPPQARTDWPWAAALAAAFRDCAQSRRSAERPPHRAAAPDDQPQHPPGQPLPENDSRGTRPAPSSPAKARSAPQPGPQTRSPPPQPPTLTTPTLTALRGWTYEDFAGAADAYPPTPDPAAPRSATRPRRSGRPPAAQSRPQPRGACSRSRVAAGWGASVTPSPGGFHP